MTFGFQPIHLIVIFVVALVVFGPQRLPEIGRGVGRAIVEFRRGAQEFSDGFRDELGGSATPQSSYQAMVASQTASPASGNFCISCGAPNPLEAHFCNQCGMQLPGKEPVQPAEPPPAE